jgi:hypothetical protein
VTAPIVEEIHAMKDPHREGRGVERTVRWKRTVTLEGPVDWIRDSWSRALSDGVHVLGSKRGIQCRVEVVTEDWESVRGMQGPTSNQAMDDLRTMHPEAYEAIHGAGTVKAHAANPASSRAGEASSTQAPEAAYVGQYL